MWLTFADVSERLDELVGRKVSLHGRVIVAGDSFFAASYDAFLEGRRIPIRDNGVIRRTLLDTLPPYGGGACIYDEEAWLEGSIERTPSSSKVIALDSCKVRRDENEIVIPVAERE